MLKILFATSLMISGPLISYADNQRYASINHINSAYINRGICSYSFIIDNGGAFSEFQDMELTIKALDMFGRLINYHTLAIEAFGSSNATRSTMAYLEMECPEREIYEFEVVGAIEHIGSRKMELPLNIFHAKNPRLARTAIQTAPGTDTIHRNFIGTWVTDKRLCTNPEIMSDEDYIVTISGETAKMRGWQYRKVETFNLNDGESSNDSDVFGGWAEFFQFAPDYSQTYGTHQSVYRLNNNVLSMDDWNIQLYSCQR
ncbi:IrmA family protein [Ignatzschineria sp. LJL83]